MDTFYAGAILAALFIGLVVSRLSATVVFLMAAIACLLAGLIEPDAFWAKATNEGLAERKLLASNNMLSALSKRGIGGISEPDRIRCFHTWYAAHMVVPNAVGEIVDQLLADATPRALLTDSD